jgi:hypothetical protein
MHTAESPHHQRFQAALNCATLHRQARDVEAAAIGAVHCEDFSMASREQSNKTCGTRRNGICPAQDHVGSATVRQPRRRRVAHEDPFTGRHASNLLDGDVMSRRPLIGFRMNALRRHAALRRSSSRASTRQMTVRSPVGGFLSWLVE